MEDSDYKTLVKDYFREQKELNYLRDTRIISKNTDTVTASTTSYDELQIRGSLSEKKELLLATSNLEARNKLIDFHFVNIQDIGSKLNDDEAIIVFVSPSSTGVTHRLVLTNERVWVNAIMKLAPLSFFSTAEAEGFLENITSTSLTLDRFDLDQASHLYAPLLHDLDNYKKLYIVADGVLKKIPFHALYDSAEKKWAVEKFDFRYLPDLQSFLYLKNPEIDYKEQSFVGVGNPSLTGNSVNLQLSNLFKKRGLLTA